MYSERHIFSQRVAATSHPLVYVAVLSFFFQFPGKNETKNDKIEPTRFCE